MHLMVVDAALRPVHAGLRQRELVLQYLLDKIPEGCDISIQFDLQLIHGGVADVALWIGAHGFAGVENSGLAPETLSNWATKRHPAVFQAALQDLNGLQNCSPADDRIGRRNGGDDVAGDGLDIEFTFHGNVVNLRPKVGHGGDEVHRKVIVLIERHLLPSHQLCKAVDKNVRLSFRFHDLSDIDGDFCSRLRVEGKGLWGLGGPRLILQLQLVFNGGVMHLVIQPHSQLCGGFVGSIRSFPQVPESHGVIVVVGHPK
mmetsp:Transcript_12877/g.23395  ORF Transcript_12877/g.23395 Transcript_12877/m.23395 type:complete len:258 (-) Transcript_12877:661-1434(-)